MDPILDLTVLRSGMGGAEARGAAVLREPGDFGELRTTATFLTLWASPADLPPGAWLEGDLGVPGLLWSLAASET